MRPQKKQSHFKDKSMIISSYNVNFYCRSSKATKKGLSPVEISIIINGKRVFIQLPRKEYPEAFKKAVESRKNNEIKEYLDEVRNQFNHIQLDLMRNNIPLTSDTLKEYFKSGGFKPYTVGDLWEDYLSIQQKRVGINLSKMAYDKYVSARNTFYSFVPQETDLRTLTPSVIQNILVSLQQKYKEGTVCSIMTKIKTVFFFAKDNGKININLFQSIKYGRGKKDIVYLTDEEILVLRKKKIEIDRLDKVRDIAVFQLSSGLAYIDVMELTKEDIKFQEDGTCYIYKKRHKTKNEFTAVVFPEGVEILKKYNFQLPKISNQKGNAYLKEIQTICGLHTNLTFHLFRRTYATRLINSGVRLEVVSKCLGHASTAITQQAYSKLLNKTVINEVKKIF